jgi:hypothetical protein
MFAARLYAPADCPRRPGDERLQRLHPRQQPHQIVLAPKREHRIDQIVPNPASRC